MRNSEQFNKKLNRLADWIDELRERAERDEDFAYSIFEDLEKDLPFAIVGGWSEGFSEEYSDVLYISKSCPNYAMCIKIGVNDGPWLYTDYDLLNMPVDDSGEVEDTNIALERDDVSIAAAEFYLRELYRLIDEHKTC